MVARDQTIVDTSGPGSGNKDAPSTEGNDACRCKEAANMTPRQLLELMLSDLAFWKKAKKG